MAKMWPDVEKSPEYLNLPPQSKIQAKKDYWDNIISNDSQYIGLPKERQELAKRRFFGGLLVDDASESQFQAPNIALKTAGDTLGVIGKSAKELIDPVLHPIETAKSLGVAVTHPIETAKAIGGAYKDRYGGIDNIADTVANDPVGFVADAFLVGGATGSGLRAIGKALNKPGLISAASTPMATAASKKVADEAVKTAKVVSRKIVKSPAKLAQEATDIYRDILRPTQGEIKKIEIGRGQDINKFYRLAAEEGLQIAKTADNKLDTKLAIEALQPKIKSIHEGLNAILDSDPVKKFDLLELGEEVKRTLDKTIKNAEELATSKANVNRYISAEIERHGGIVNARTLNEIKQGMWGVGFDQLNMTAKKAARDIGHAAKNKIEQAFPDNVIKTLNNKSGEYQTLTTLLENADGRVIKGGRLGGYVAKGIGAIAGSKIPVVGPIGGMLAADKAANFIYDPVRRANNASRKMQKAIRRTPKKIDSFSPEVVERKPIKRTGIPSDIKNAALFLEKEKQFGLPKPKRKPYEPTGSRNIPDGYPIDMGVSDEYKRFEKANRIKSEMQAFKESTNVQGIRQRAIDARISEMPREIQPLARKSLDYSNVEDFIDAVVPDRASVNVKHFIDFYNSVRGIK